jgi:hypothetical protein
MIEPSEDEGRSGRSDNGKDASPRVGVKATKIAGTSAYVLRAKGYGNSAGAQGAPADLNNNLVASIAAEAGAHLPEALPGCVAVELADGTQTRILSERHESAAFFPSMVVGAETFLKWMGRYAILPLGASPVGRRFVRRSITVDGVTGVRFAEAGRDV